MPETASNPAPAAASAAPSEGIGTDAAGTDAAGSDAAELSERDRKIIELESHTFRFVGTKERAIREQLAMSRTAYYVRLNALLDDPAALRAAPALVNRLRDRRTSADEPAPAGRDHRVA